MKNVAVQGAMSRILCVCMIICSAYMINGFPYDAPNPLAETKYGVVMGSWNQSRYGNFYKSFRGIPYAKPPIGQLRFKDPESPITFEFPYDATKEGNFCIQKNYFFKDPKVEGSEDCLNLNVYVPEQVDLFQGELLPVMVFIHWGGFFAGRGTSDYLGPDYFMDEGVILVTLNYRLGIFGFLSTLDDNAPGNFGFKDQVAALKWVQDNIRNFGGDPYRVTLFGQSAGSGSVHLHLLSPLSKGLFSAAISQSGTALNLWAKPTNLLQPNILAVQAKLVGCDEYLGKNDKLLECLRDVDAGKLLETQDQFKYFSTEPLTVYGVVTEKQTTSNPRPFITKEPLQYITAREFHPVPWILGFTQDEGILRAAPFLRQPKVLQELNEKFSALLPSLMYLTLSVGTDTASTASLAKNITDFYLGQPKVNVDDASSVQGFIDLYSDRSMTYGGYQAVMLHSSLGHDPIWFYNFDYKGQYSYGDLFAATDDNIKFYWGVSHCDDLLYLFNSPALFPPLTDPKDIVMSIKMVKLWTNFAKYRTPLTRLSPYTDLPEVRQWDPVEIGPNMRNEDLYYLNITGSHLLDHCVQFTYQNGFHPARMQFWEKQKLAENVPGLN